MPSTTRVTPAFSASTCDLVLGARHARDGQHRLGRGDGQRAQASPLAPDEEDGFEHGATLPHQAERSGRPRLDAVTVPAALAALLALDPARPLVTHLGADGARTELSVRT